MISEALAKRALQTIESEPPSLQHRVLMQIFCSCLTSNVDIPQVAVRPLETAVDFWIKGKGESRDLLSQREQCWKHLETIGATNILTDPKVIFIRAVVCTLYVEPQEESWIRDTLEWFVQLMNKLGNQSEAFQNALTGIGRS